MISMTKLYVRKLGLHLRMLERHYSEARTALFWNPHFVMPITVDVLEAHPHDLCALYSHF